MSALEGRGLCLVVPGLFGPAAPDGVDPSEALEALVAGLDLRATELLLSRARPRRGKLSAESPEDLLFGAFGYRPAGADWPAAAVTRYADTGGAGEGFWLRADPVHLQPDAGGLVLFDGSEFQLERAEAEELAHTVSAHFAGEGWSLQTPHALRWYLELDYPVRLKTTPLSMVRLKNVDAHLPEGEDAQRWHRLLNETQMVLHDCDVNRRREARGEPIINSLWFWGSGKLPKAPPAEWFEAHGNSVLLRGLAGLAGVPCRALPDGAEDWLASAREGAHLVLIDDSHAPAQSSDLEAWRDALDEFNRRWSAALVRALDRGALSTVSVLTEGNVRYDSGMVRWWHRWKRRRSFAALCPFD